MTEALAPASGKHSISRVVATLFIPQHFLKPEDVLNMVKDLPCYSSYQKKNTVNSTTMSFGTNSVGVSKNEITGFSMEEYDKSGKLTNILRMENLPNINKSSISLESRDYPGWTSFRDKVIIDIKNLSEKISIYVDAINLNFVDEFQWNSSSKIDVDSIFNVNSQLLNSQFRKSTEGVLILLSQNQERTEEFESEDRTEVSFSNTRKRVMLNHQQALKLNNLELFTNMETNGKLVEYYNLAHKANKNVLSDVLSEEVLSLIGFNK